MKKGVATGKELLAEKLLAVAQQAPSQKRFGTAAIEELIAAAGIAGRSFYDEKDRNAAGVETEIRSPAHPVI